MKILKLSLLSLAVFSVSAHAKDARSIAMGDTGITTGKGVSGAMLNPALLMKHKQQGKKGSFRIGVNAGVRDKDNILEDVNDSKDTIDELDKAIRQAEGITVSSACTSASATADTVCATNVGELRNAAQKTRDLVSNVSGKPLEVAVGLNLGFSYTGNSVPFAVNLGGGGIASTTVTAAPEDLTYFDALLKTNGNRNDLTLQDIIDSGNKIIVKNNGQLTIEDTDEFNLNSNVNGFGVVRSEIAVALAKDVTVKEHTFFAGVTPKVVTMIAGNINQKLTDENDFDLEEQLDDNKVEATKFTFDAGALYTQPNRPELSYGVVLKNVIPYSVTTNDNIDIDTGIQLKVGAGYETERYNVSVEAALNEAKDAGIDTQPLGVGIEGNWKWFGLRAGLSHDLAASDNATSYSIGTDLGFIELGAKFNGNSSAEVSLQIASDF